METVAITHESILKSIENWTNDKDSENARAFMTAIEVILNGDMKARNQLIEFVSGLHSSTLELKEDPEDPTFIEGKVNLSFLEHAIFRIDSMLSQVEEMHRVMQLKKTSENFPDVFSESEFKRLANQHIARLVPLISAKIGYMILWQQGIESGNCVKQMGKL